MRNIIFYLLEAFIIVLFARVILSWFPINPGTPLATVMRGLYAVTEPVLAPIRRVLPPMRMGGMGLDLSPLIVLIVLQVVAGAVRS